VLTIATLAKTASTRRPLGAPARGNAAAGNVTAESPRKQIARPILQSEVSLHQAAAMHAAISVKPLWKITLGILIYAVVAAVIPISISI
jgi:hypothetical protein